MRYELRRHIAPGLVAMWLLPATLAAQDIVVEAPDEVGVGASIEVHWQGGENARDFITIVPVDAAAGKYEAYQYAT
ncbi:MAG: hypothetical protein RLN69_05545, partial [Woeseiaceae bacterium]